jgi:hypothetical protein
MQEFVQEILLVGAPKLHEYYLMLTAGDFYEYFPRLRGRDCTGDFTSRVQSFRPTARDFCVYFPRLNARDCTGDFTSGVPKVA